MVHSPLFLRLFSLCSLGGSDDHGQKRPEALAQMETMLKRVRCPHIQRKKNPKNQSQGFPGDTSAKESAGDSRDVGLTPGSKRSPGEGSSN